MRLNSKLEESKLWMSEYIYKRYVNYLTSQWLGNNSDGGHGSGRKEGINNIEVSAIKDTLDMKVYEVRELARNKKS